MSNDRQPNGERGRDPAEIGALWLKKGQKGDYLSGTIDGVGAVVCFPIRSTNPKAPAYRVLKSQPRDERPDASQRLDDRAPRERRSSRVDDINDEHQHDSHDDRRRSGSRW